MESDDATLIFRGVLSLTRRLRSERPEGGPSPSAIAILAVLRRRGPMPAVALAAEERLQPQSLTRLLTQLETDGLISRMQDPADRRRILISATQRGLAAFADDMRPRRRWLEEAMAANLTDTECRTLIDAARIMRKLSDYDSNANAEEAPALLQ